jgi:hypothetical protein
MNRLQASATNNSHDLELRSRMTAVAFAIGRVLDLFRFSPARTDLEATMFFKSAATLFLLTVGFAAPAHAQLNKQIISGTWYEDRAAATNPSSTLTLTFAQTPTNQFLNITNVACTVVVDTTQAMSQITLFGGTTSGANDLGRSYSLKGSATPETAGSAKYYSIVTNQVYYKFGPGRFPSIEIDTQTTGTNSIIANCVIVGNLTDN